MAGRGLRKEDWWKENLAGTICTDGNSQKRINNYSTSWAIFKLSENESY